jgi:hypothetical protein
MMSAISFHSNARPGAATIAPTIASNAGRHASAAPCVWEEEEFTLQREVFSTGLANLPSWYSKQGQSSLFNSPPKTF